MQALSIGAVDITAGRKTAPWYIQDALEADVKYFCVWTKLSSKPWDYYVKIKRYIVKN